MNISQKQSSDPELLFVARCRWAGARLLDDRQDVTLADYMLWLQTTTRTATQYLQYRDTVLFTRKYPRFLGNPGTSGNPAASAVSL